MTVIIFAKDARLRKPSSYLIMSLAIADLFIGSVSLPMWIYQLGLGILWHSRISYHGFNAFLAIDIFTNLASISNLTAISLERLYATLCPWRHRATSRARFQLFILVVWTLPIISSVLYIVARFVVSVSAGYPVHLATLPLPFVTCDLCLVHRHLLKDAKTHPS